MSMSQVNPNDAGEEELDDTGEALEQGEELNFLDAPDDEIMAMSSAPAPKAATPPASEDAGAKKDDAAGGDETAGGDTGAAGGGKPEGEVDGGQADDAKPATDAALNAPDNQIPDPKAAKPAATDAATDDKTKDAPATDDKSKDTATPPAAGQLTLEQKAAAYDGALATFKANGKDFTPQSIDELRQLAQMGCNYTKKMQELQPVKRIITMLSNNQLLDEGKLNFLIDLDKGNPEAIQKLLNDRQIDPLTLDKDKAASYQPGNHQVSDEVVNLQSAMEEVMSTPTGKELITSIKDTWDERSKQALFQDPATLRVINEHKANGLYAHVTAEMDRLTTLGQIPAGTPFLQSYYAVGEMLQDKWKKAAEEQAKQTVTPPAAPPAKPAPETRVVVPPSQVANNDKAKAAAPTKSGAPTAKQEVNYLDIPDDEFLKRTGHRL